MLFLTPISSHWNRKARWALWLGSWTEIIRRESYTQLSRTALFALMLLKCTDSKTSYNSRKQRESLMFIMGTKCCNHLKSPKYLFRFEYLSVMHQTLVSMSHSCRWFAWTCMIMSWPHTFPLLSIFFSLFTQSSMLLTSLPSNTQVNRC